MPRKHLITSGIAKKQQSQAKIWMKLAKEIKAAAKIGGVNIESNPRLKAAIDKALLNNLSKDSIDKNIYGSQKDKDNLLDLEYELFGPNGLGIIIKALSDNSNRTISSIRGYSSKINSIIAKPNSVKKYFDLKGEILLEKNSYINEDLLINYFIDLPIEDIVDNEDCFQILTDTKDFFEVEKSIKKFCLENDFFRIINAEIKYVPNTYINIEKNDYLKLEKFLNNCEQDDDIQSVTINLGEIL